MRRTNCPPAGTRLTIYHETAFTTGEDNIREDGNAYYDNYALFDCLIVQKEPTEDSTPGPNGRTDGRADTCSNCKAADKQRSKNGSSFRR